LTSTPDASSPAFASVKALREDPAFTVKVMGGNEVRAIYEVDEQKIEISLSLPNEFPLVGAQVKEVRKIGVKEAVWRGWILGVGSMVNSQVRDCFLNE
jgi:E3 ubiquitin-protein ligase listerin